MRFSVVVATYNRKELLRRCLIAMLNQKLPAYEIIVVDDASTDGTSEMVQREFPQVRYIRQESNRGPAAARNLGIQAANGDIIAFTDDDCEPPPHWLKDLQRGFERYPEAGAIGGIQEAPKAVLQHNWLARYERFVTRQVYGVGEHPVVGRPAPGGTNNLAIRRDLLQRLRGFDEFFPIAAGEDADLLHRLADLGYMTVCLPIKVTHNQSYSWCAFVRQQVRRGIGAAYFYQKRGALPSLFREVLRIPATLPLFVRDLWRYHSPIMAVIHSISRLFQAWGRLKARRSLSSLPSEYAWRESPSFTKLHYITHYATGRTALDIGTGAGFYANTLHQYGYQIVGVDLRPQQLPGIPLVQARMSALPFAEPFDTVLAFDVLEHEEDEARALDELYRLTGFRLILSVPNTDHQQLPSYNLTYKHHIDKTHIREYSAEELISKLELAGFRIIVLQPEGPVSPAVLAEFVRPGFLRAPVRLLLKALHRLKVLENRTLMADLYVVAEPKRKL